MDLYKLMYNKQELYKAVPLTIFPKLKAEVESLVNFNVACKILVIINENPELDLMSFLGHHIGEEKVWCIDLTKVSSPRPSILLQKTEKVKLLDYASWNQRVFIRDNLQAIGKMIAIVDACIYESDSVGCVFTRQQIRQLQVEGRGRVIYLGRPGVRQCQAECGFRSLDFHRQYWGPQGNDDMGYIEVIRSYMCASKLDLTDRDKEQLDKAAEALFKGKSIPRSTPSIPSKRSAQQLQETAIQHAKSPKHLMFDILRYHRALYTSSVSRALISEALSDMAQTSTLQYYNFQPSQQHFSALTFLFQSLSHQRQAWDMQIFTQAPSVFVSERENYTQEYDVPLALQRSNGPITKEACQHVTDIDSEISEP